MLEDVGVYSTVGMLRPAQPNDRTTDIKLFI
jgi:hypothetical protein